MTDDSRWKPTMNLRFQKRTVPIPGHPNMGRELLILQQQWQWDSEPLYVEKEATEWRDVPTALPDPPGMTGSVSEEGLSPSTETGLSSDGR